MKLLLYCCKSKKDLLQWAPLSMFPYNYGCFDDLYESEEELNGKIVAECDFDLKVETLGKNYVYSMELEFVKQGDKIE